MRSGDGSVESWIMSRVGRRTPLTAFRTLRIEEYGRRITVTALFPPIGALADAEREPWFQACFRHGARHGTGSRPALRYCHCLLLFGTFCALRPGAIDRAYCPDLEPGSCCIVEAKLSGESVGLPMLAGASLCDERISFIARKPRCPRVRRSPDVILAKLREVIHHQAQIIAARIVVGQLVAPSIGEKAFQFALAQPCKRHRLAILFSISLLDLAMIGLLFRRLVAIIFRSRLLRYGVRALTQGAMHGDWSRSCVGPAWRLGLLLLEANPASAKAGAGPGTEIKTPQFPSRLSTKYRRRKNTCGFPTRDGGDQRPTKCVTVGQSPDRPVGAHIFFPLADPVTG